MGKDPTRAARMVTALSGLGRLLVHFTYRSPTHVTTLLKVGRTLWMQLHGIREGLVLALKI